MGMVDKEGDSGGLVVLSGPGTCLYIGDNSPKKAQYEDLANVWCINAMSKCRSRDDDILKKQVSRCKNEMIPDLPWFLLTNRPTLGLTQLAASSHGNGKSSQGQDKWSPADPSTDRLLGHH